MILSIEHVKRYLNIDEDYKEDDDLLVNLINICELAIAKYINRESLDEFGLDDTKENSTLRAAALMLIASMYKDRESSVDRQLHTNPAFDILLAPLYKYGFPHEERKDE